MFQKMDTTEPRINGEWPDVLNKKLDELIVQEYWYAGKQEEQANVVWLKINGAWLRLYFDSAIIFWRSSENEPSYSAPGPNESHNYPLRNLGAELRVRDQTIVKCEPTVIVNGAQVTLSFGNGRKLTFKSVNDSTTIET